MVNENVCASLCERHLKPAFFIRWGHYTTVTSTNFQSLVVGFVLGFTPLHCDFIRKPHTQNAVAIAELLISVQQWTEWSFFKTLCCNENISFPPP